MPTPIDRAMKSNSLFLGFAGLVTAVAAWSIWGQDSMFPAETNEPNTPPEEWTKNQLKRWLESRKLEVHSSESREELLARVQDIKNRMVKSGE